MPLDRAAVDHTASAIAPYVRITPTLRLDAGEFGLGSSPLVFKLELLQHAGCFKTRGAFANLLLRQPPAAGVIAASGGNHGAAVAYAAMRLGIPAHIFVPTVSSPAKVDRIRSFRAHLTITGDRYDDALQASLDCAADTGAMTVHAFNQHETLLATATLAREWAAQTPDLDTVLIAVGGGGLLGGIAGWFANRVRVVGVEPEGAPTLTRALAAGRPVDAPTEGIAADSLAPKRVGELMFPIAQSCVDRVVLVSDAAIQDAQHALWDKTRIVAEPGAAAPFAALLSGRYVPAPSERVGVLICGGNTTAVNFPS